MNPFFSFIIPVYNRPGEVDELLMSFSRLDYDEDYEIVLVEDGSTIPSRPVVERYPQLPITYFEKANSGPGPSRNYGMARARGDYFIILDSDVLLPINYLLEVKKELQSKYVDFFGGPDAAHVSFSDLQKAIDFTMTSFLTTGGIRGGKSGIDKFQPRSFNMGISKKAFEATAGFGKIHPGEDPDLTFRLWKQGFESRLLPEAFVYHKRRINWKKFYQQVRKFGLVRPILNTWHPGTAKITYWFPSFFVIGLLVAVLLAALGLWIFMACYGMYMMVLWATALVKTKNIKTAFLSLAAVLVQFLGYGTAFLQSTIALQCFKKDPQEKFPHLFFD
ncbi:MAG: glycosyl transferase family 2 [Cytophagaceae bacterium]|nr:glycosyl transferase family 2 [Cytophagaceae bacterium]